MNKHEQIQRRKALRRQKEKQEARELDEELKRQLREVKKAINKK